MTPGEIVLRSYAKINLGLQVLGRRPDGYHEIRTVFQSIALHDRLTLRRTRRSVISFRSDSRELHASDNLVTRAAELIRKKARVPGGLQIFLEKKIPLGSGMGGGSSNAAMTLLGLDRLLGLNLTSQELLDWSSELGSDVPFFLVGGKALGLGRGSEVYPLEDMPRKPLLVVVPEERVATADAYERLSLRLTKGRAASMIPVFCSGYWNSLNGGKAQENDFEVVFFSSFPQWKKLKDDWLDCGAETAGLTGSGSALFGIFTNRRALLKAASATRRNGLQLIQTYTLNRLQYQKGLVESLH